MKFFFDLFPVILFFAVFKFKGIFAATAVAIIASFVQIGWMLARRRKVEPMMWISLIIITLFGGATILLHNESFIKWKPSILYWVMGSTILISQLFFDKNAMKALMSKQVTLADNVWKKINMSWGLFFVVLGFINLWVIYHFSTDTWVNFKLFGIMGLIVVFSIVQGVVITKTQKEDAAKE